MTQLTYDVIQGIRQSLGNLPGVVQNALLGPPAQMVAIQNKRIAAEAQRDIVQNQTKMGVIQTAMGLTQQRRAEDRQDAAAKRTMAFQESMQDRKFNHDMTMLELQLAGKRRRGGGGRRKQEPSGEGQKVMGNKLFSDAEAMALDRYPNDPVARRGFRNEMLKDAQRIDLASVQDDPEKQKMVMGAYSDAFTISGQAGTNTGSMGPALENPAPDPYPQPEADPFSYQSDTPDLGF